METKIETKKQQRRRERNETLVKEYQDLRGKYTQNSRTAVASRLCDKYDLSVQRIIHILQNAKVW